MNSRKIIILSIILMFLIAPISFADDGDYTIPSVIKDIVVTDNGAVIISEEIVYDIEGSVNGVYRDIPHSNNQTITDISVDTPGYYNTVKVIESDQRTKIKVYLYKDAEKKYKTYDAKVAVTYHYTFNNGVKVYNDIAELQYMTWGDEWDTGVDNLKSVIHIPGSKDGTEYWNNPEDFVVSSQWTDDNTLTTILEGITSRTSYEQRILIPKSYFKSYENAQVINIDAKAKIEEDQKEYANGINSRNMFSNILAAIMGILMVIPLGIYGLFGREPKIDYKADYEYDLPTGSSPIEVNSIVIGNVGQLDDKAVHATIMDLIDRKYYKVIASNDEDTIIRQQDKDISNLKDYEQSLINYLSKFEVNGDISLKSIADTEEVSSFQSFKSSWLSMASKDVPDSLIDRFFDDKGSKIFLKLSILLLILGILVTILTFIIDLNPKLSIIIMFLGILMTVEAIIMLVIPNTIAGKWTPEGKEYHDKWKNFENYIKDFSLIKERPPASIEVWGKYLVYASALGCADKVTENMKKYFDLKQVSSDYYDDNHVVMFAYYGGFHNLNTTFDALTPHDSDSDGIGSAGGGGFGGGGGGTF